MADIRLTRHRGLAKTVTLVFKGGVLYRQETTKQNRAFETAHLAGADAPCRLAVNTAANAWKQSSDNHYTKEASAARPSTERETER